jgi:hypothetical protein
MELDAAGAKLFAVDRDHRIAKVRSKPVRPGATMHDLDASAVGQWERTAEQTIIPCRRDVTFGDVVWQIGHAIYPFV